MNYGRVIEEIGKHKWWSEKGPAVPQALLYPLYGFITQSRVFHPEYLTITILAFSDGLFYEETPEDEKYEVYNYIFDQMKKDSNYLLGKKKQNEEIVKEFFKELKFFAENKDKLDNKELWVIYGGFIRKYKLYMEYALGLECVDIFTVYHLERLVRQELPGIDNKEITDILINLSVHLGLSFMEKERLQFLRLCLDNYDHIKKNKLDGSLKTGLNKLSKNYFWILNNLKETRYLDQKHYFEKAREEIGKGKKRIERELKGLETKIDRLRDEKSRIYSRYSLSDDLKLHFKILEIMSGCIDSRKKNMITATSYIFDYCREITRRFSLDFNDVCYYRVEELKELLLDNKMVESSEIKRRRECSAFVLTKAPGNSVKADIFYGKEAQNILDAISSQFQTKEIKGQIACSPVKKLSGKAQVILDVSKQKFEEGNILVTTMTRPEFVPLMRKAKAIITDEGGITCHAAIISRELGIPCIIGTKIATKALKDGDLIEVDTNKGIVKKLK